VHFVEVRIADQVVPRGEAGARVAESQCRDFSRTTIWDDVKIREHLVDTSRGSANALKAAL